MNLRIFRHLEMKTSLLVLLGLTSLSLSAAEKTLVDYFQPMTLQGSLVSVGVWGDANVVPRDIKNGLEDSSMKNWCYWDGGVVKGDDGRYHLYASRWAQSFSHTDGWHVGSKGVHAVSDHIMGPYVDKGLTWPGWRDGMGHNVTGLRMHDGRFALVTSEITDGEVFVSDSPDGPFKLLGKIQTDANGFDPDLARYAKNGRMSNVAVILRPDGNYMIIPRSTAPLLSEHGILGPYKIMGDRIYKNYPELPQTKNEDPTVWYSGGRYHIVYNNWPTKTAYHFTSEDGIHDWKYRGIAYKKDEFKIFRHPDGTVNDWQFIERPTAVVENGHVTHFFFSVIDVTKGQDLANDNHGSKIVFVPFDGVAFDRDTQALVTLEKAGASSGQEKK